MSLGLLLPLGLAALAAWIVPLLIHLVRRPEQAPYDFPALRWLRESERPRRRLRLEDPGLLLLRLFLLALLALLLAVPVLNGEWRGARHWILASESIDIDAARALASDKEARWHWLAPGFPEIERARPARKQPTASLIREFEASLPESDTLTVLVADEADGFDAERIALGRSIEWVVAPALEPPADEAVEKKNLKIALRHSNVDQPALHYLRAALAALAKDESGGLQVDDKALSEAVDADSDALIWLGGKLPDDLLPWIAAGGRVLVIDPQSQAGSIVLRDQAGDVMAREQAMAAGAVVSLQRPLTPDSMPLVLDADFPARLRVLLEGAAPPPTRAIAAEVMPRQANRVQQPPPAGLAGLLCLIIAIVFLLERIVALRRRHPA